MTTAPRMDPFDNGWSDVTTLLASTAVPAVEPPAPEVSHAGCDSTREQLQAEIGSLTRILHVERAAAAKRAAAEEAKRQGFGAWIDTYGAWLALYATIGLTASGEYALAVLAGWPQMIAWLFPTAIDIYVTVALRRHRDLFAALGLMLIVNVVYHLAAQRLFGTLPDGAPTWWLIAGAAAVAPYVMWRVHHLTAPETAPAETAETAPARDGETVSETGLTATLARVSQTPLEVSHETPHALTETAHETSRETPAGSSHETPHPGREIACETPSGQREAAVSAPVETPRTNRPTTARHSRPKARARAAETPVRLLPIDDQMQIVRRLIAEHGDVNGLLPKVAKELGVSKATAGRRVQDFRNLQSA